MKNKRLWLLLIGSLVFIVGLAGCGVITDGPHGSVEYNLFLEGEPDPELYFGNPKSFPLVAGQHIEVGEIIVGNNDEFLYVTYKTDDPWFLEEVHLYVLKEEPQTRLIPGQAPYKKGDLPNETKEITLLVPLKNLDLEGEICEKGLWLQAHAAVVKVEDGEPVQGETAYGGEIFNPNQGAWYGNIFYELQCKENGEDENGEFQTETAWGGDIGINIKAPGAWWYYFDTEEKETQTIWAGQTIEVGEVTIDENNGKNKITIIFNEDWQLQDVEESVKIQGYEKIPNSRPVAGQFTTYKGEELVVTVPIYSFYAIHLDVQKGN